MKELKELCNSIRELSNIGNYSECERLITDAMQKYPHSPEPHNLWGVVLEKEGEHVEAMKHFRAAYALDPSYAPARQNLDNFSTRNSHAKCAYDETDCFVEKSDKFVISYDKHGIGHV